MQAIAVLDGIANGESARSVRAATGAGTKSIERMRRDHAIALRAARAVMAENAAKLAEKNRRLAVQRLDLMDPEQATNDADRAEREKILLKTGPKDLALSYAITLDKQLRLEGEPDMRVVDEDGPGLSGVMRKLEAVEKRCSGVVWDAGTGGVVD